MYLIFGFCICSPLILHLSLFHYMTITSESVGIYCTVRDTMNIICSSFYLVLFNRQILEKQTINYKPLKYTFLSSIRKHNQMKESKKCSGLGIRSQNVSRLEVPIFFSKLNCLASRDLQDETRDTLVGLAKAYRASRTLSLKALPFSLTITYWYITYYV